MATVDARVTGLLKGCKCKTGCSSKSSSCRNKGNECSIGCDCINCTNTLTKGKGDLLNIVVDEYLAEVTGESTGVPDDANDIMDWMFGCEDLEDDEENFRLTLELSIASYKFFRLSDLHFCKRNYRF